MKIGNQLKISFTFLLLLIITLGIISYRQSDRIHEQTKILYDHPLKVRRALDQLKLDIVSIQHDLRNMFITEDEEEVYQDILAIGSFQADALVQADVLSGIYLGPRSDVDTLKQSLILWNINIDALLQQFRDGKTQNQGNLLRNLQNSNALAEKALRITEKLDIFAKNKSDQLYLSSNKLNTKLNRQLALLVAVFLLVSIIIFYVLSRTINKPIAIITETALRFRDGDLNARSPFTSSNELGVLSDGFNKLAESVQLNLELSRKIDDFSRLMFTEDDTRQFFLCTLKALAENTDSQLAAIYLRSDDMNTFEHFESIGAGDNARQAFSATNLEGELGLAISSRKIQHIIEVPSDSRFAFHTEGGTFIPREIITIPLLVGNEVVAVISLAGIREYSKQTVEFIDNIQDILNARVAGVLAYKKVKEFTLRLESQNHELEAQKKILKDQSAELAEQNTELEIQKGQLAEANRMKTMFLSNTSHELRTPLNSVIVLAGVLNKKLAGKIPDEEYSYLDVIERNGRQLLSLINDILDISRIEAGHEEMEITTFNFGEMVAEVVGTVGSGTPKKNIKLLQKKIAPDLIITSDVGKCQHILENIIGNAMKFTLKGKVEIEATKDQENIKVVVTDTGIGIPENHLPYIFDEFRQVEDSTSRRFGGTGLGLALVKKYTELIGGTISVKSTPGKGSEFTLTIPLRYGPVDSNGENSPHNRDDITVSKSYDKPGNDTQGKTILLVDDSETAIMQIRDILEESGYKLLVARDGAEALEIITRTIPDAMILDLMMPGIDGFQVLASIRGLEHLSRLPVLVLTAKEISPDEFNFLKENGIYQVIQKGKVSPRKLIEALNRMLFPGTGKSRGAKKEHQAIESKPSVLVIEDNPDNRIAVKSLLKSNYTVIEAGDGNEGMKLARIHKPDLILMDIELPGMDGVSAFKTIRKDPALLHIPVIALAATVLLEEKEKILTHGFDGFMSKPIDEKLFYNTINEVIHGK